MCRCACGGRCRLNGLPHRQLKEAEFLRLLAFGRNPLSGAAELCFSLVAAELVALAFATKTYIAGH